MSSPAACFLLSFSSPEAFFFILSVCVCFPFTQNLPLKTCFVYVSFPCPPLFTIYFFRVFVFLSFLLSRQLVKSVEIFLCLSSSVLLGPLFFSLPPADDSALLPPPPSSYKDQTLTVDRTAGHFGQDREDLLRPVISTF
ncbi:hypothetical protein CI102_2737 [Trichoderma harzianum]|uniref:Uncharacterized protein n=1 Tax=Trichoderma harzianum CBS 226.95 TaxID=983964 RepID=A0A2T3ZTY3_TRIHA|nr:hypothetical protein M431DRAFT_331181 [Trichoderma harzianum CBS 226.95]PKK53008.1 hypothetical protein CI102_2737 [Trichoderma harzianum]PTB48262.1 hypothetical protein M431DRAFT_331181 [Trichoderma harzianum CBS 226.95]